MGHDINSHQKALSAFILNLLYIGYTKRRKYLADRIAYLIVSLWSLFYKIMKIVRYEM